MTSLRQIVTDAYRENGIIQIGTDPTSEQMDEGIRRLEAIILSLYGNEMGGPLSPIAVGSEGAILAYSRTFDRSQYLSSYYVPPNSQLVVNGGTGYTVYLNPEPQDGERVSVVDVSQNFATYPFIVNGNGRRIEADRSVTLTENGVSANWFYRSDIAKWVRVSALTVDSDSPFPPEFDDFLVVSLAMRLFSRLQTSTSQETMMVYRRARSQFRARYRLSYEVYPDVALVRLRSRYPNGSVFEGPAGNTSFTFGEVIVGGGDASG